MRFQLAKTLEGLKMYGPIYDLGTGGPETVEEFVTDDIDDWFLDNMVDRINDVCDTLLDDGDVDYIGAEKCEDLLHMIDNLPDGFVPNVFVETVEVLKDFAKRAIEYDTGIEIEM